MCECGYIWLFTNRKQQKPTNPNAATQNSFVKQTISTALYIFPLFPYQCGLWSVERGGVDSVEFESMKTVKTVEC